MKNISLLVLLGSLSINQAVQLSKQEGHHHDKKQNQEDEKYHKALNKYGSKHFSAPYQKQQVQISQEAQVQLSDWSGDDLQMMDADSYVGSAPITYIPPKTSLQRHYFNLEDKDVLTYGQWSHDPTHLVKTQSYDTYGPNEGGYVQLKSELQSGHHNKHHHHSRHHKSEAGSRFGPENPPYHPWNIDNHHSSDEKTWTSGAPQGYTREPQGPAAKPSLSQMKERYHFLSQVKASMNEDEDTAETPKAQEGDQHPPKSHTDKNGVTRMSNHNWEKEKKKQLEEGDPDNVFGNPWDHKNNKNSNPTTWVGSAPKDYMVEPIDISSKPASSSQSKSK